jgi:hypothetical protein
MRPSSSLHVWSIKMVILFLITGQDISLYEFLF